MQANSAEEQKRESRLPPFSRLHNVYARIAFFLNPLEVMNTFGPRRAPAIMLNALAEITNDLEQPTAGNISINFFTALSRAASSPDNFPKLISQMFFSLTDLRSRQALLLSIFNLISESADLAIKFNGVCLKALQRILDNVGYRQFCALMKGPVVCSNKKAEHLFEIVKLCRCTSVTAEDIKRSYSNAVKKDPEFSHYCWRLAKRFMRPGSEERLSEVILQAISEMGSRPHEQSNLELTFGADTLTEDFIAYARFLTDADVQNLRQQIIRYQINPLDSLSKEQMFVNLCHTYLASEKSEGLRAEFIEEIWPRMNGELEYLAGEPFSEIYLHFLGEDKKIPAADCLLAGMAEAGLMLTKLRCALTLTRICKSLTEEQRDIFREQAEAWLLLGAGEQAEVGQQAQGAIGMLATMARSCLDELLKYRVASSDEVCEAMSSQLADAEELESMGAYNASYLTAFIESASEEKRRTLFLPELINCLRKHELCYQHNVIATLDRYRDELTAEQSEALDLYKRAHPHPLSAAMDSAIASVRSQLAGLVDESVANEGAKEEATDDGLLRRGFFSAKRKFTVCIGDKSYEVNRDAFRHFKALARLVNPRIQTASHLLISFSHSVGRNAETTITLDESWFSQLQPNPVDPYIAGLMLQHGSAGEEKSATDAMRFI